MNGDQLDVKHNEAEHRFEINVGGEAAVLEYQRVGGDIIFTHTEVPPAYEGKGLANKLTVTGLDYARDNHLKVVPQCPFVAAYIRKHPEYQALTQ